MMKKQFFPQMNNSSLHKTIYEYDGVVMISR